MDLTCAGNAFVWQKWAMFPENMIANIWKGEFSLPNNCCAWTNDLYNCLLQSDDINYKVLISKQNVRYLTNHVTVFIFLKANCCILIPVSPKFVSIGPINNTSALVGVKSCYRTGKKLLSDKCIASGDIWWWNSKVILPQSIHRSCEVCYCYEHEYAVKQILNRPVNAYGSGHGTVAVLLPGFAINW